MRSLRNGALLCETVEDLPDFSNAREVFMDFETTSFDRRVKAFLPFHGHRICGIAVTVDDERLSWYVPIRHTDDDWNLPIDPVRAWLRDIVRRPELDWINHNVKFDMRFLHQEGIEFKCRTLDTISLSKLHNSDRLSHELKQLCRDWCDMDMDEEAKIGIYLDEIGSKNYGDVPADILGAYGCEDVIGNRELYRYICGHKDDTLSFVWENEILLTPVLYDMELAGMRVDEQELQIEKYKCLTKQIRAQDELTSLAGFEVNTKSSAQLYDLLINQYELPVVKWTEEGNPSFNKEALQSYTVHPAVLADERKKRSIELIKDLNKEIQFQSLFLDSFLEKHVNGVLYPDYNQNIRTGRTSCRNPNAQQFSARAKALIKAGDEAIITADYSQIEFRIIVHYIKDVNAIAAYANNPRTDFHQWVADQCEIKRKPAKTLNFAMGYGAGKTKVKAMLVANEDIIEDVSKAVNLAIERGKLEERDRNSSFKQLANDRAMKMYYTYHERLPGIKETAARASAICAERGFVFNQYGRRRHLPSRNSWRAFNTVCQSSAADVMKERLVATAPRYNKTMREWGIRQFATIHDDVDFIGPREVMYDPKVQGYIRDQLQTTSVEFRVPMVVDMGISTKDLKDAGRDDAVRDENGKIISGKLEI